MHQHFRPIILAVVLTVTLLGFNHACLAGDVHDDAGTSAYPFLKINVGARAVAMGGAFTGLADDEASLYYNPGGIANVEEDRFIIGYHNYFVDIQSGFGGVIKRLNPDNVLATYISYLNYGEFIETDTLGQETGETFGGGDLLWAVSFARKINYNLSVGVTAKFIYEKLQDYSSTGMAFDMGARYAGNRERWTVGMAIQNLGTQFSALGDEKYDLPLTVRSGISYRPVGLPLILASDIIIPVDNKVSIAIGGEYHEFKPFYMRLGWNSFGSNYRTGDSDDSWAGFGVGVGFDYRRLHIAYAFTPAAEIGDSHRITLTGGL